MQRPLIVVIALFALVATAMAPALAEFKCDTGQGAQCHCLGGENCKELEKSGMCGKNSLNCTNNQIGSGYGCDCTAKFKGINTNSLKPKQPLGKSQ